MERDEFIDSLASEGFGEIVTVAREPNGALGMHAHPFEAKALILEGEIRIHIDGEEQVCRPGQMFHLFANQPHTESYGPAGVKYVVGRK